MNRVVSMIAISLFLTLSAFAASDQKDVDDVLKAEHVLCKAFESGNVEFIKSHESADYTLTNSSGEITTRQDDLDDFTKGHAHWTMFENRDMKVRTYNHQTAVVLGKTFVKGTYNGKPVDIAVLFTDTFAKIDGTWVLVAGHVTRIKN